MKMVFKLLAASLLATSSGFARFLNFISVGYGGSIALQAAVTIFDGHKSLTAISAAHCAGMLLYGTRLAVFIAQRNLADSYQKNKQDIDARMSGVPLTKHLIIWPMVSLLYVAMYLPCHITVKNAPKSTALLPITGLVLMYTGFMIEAVADHQKSEAKKQTPDRYCDSGLYKLVRHPNYLGELMFWFGSYAVSVAMPQTMVQRTASTLGLLAITNIMMGATRKLDEKQKVKYGSQAKFQQYLESTPSSLLPGIY